MLSGRQGSAHPGGPDMIAPSGEQIEIVAEDQQAMVVEVGGGLAHTLPAVGSSSTDMGPTR